MGVKASAATQPSDEQLISKSMFRQLYDGTGSAKAMMGLAQTPASNKILTFAPNMRNLIKRALLNKCPPPGQKFHRAVFFTQIGSRCSAPLSNHGSVCAAPDPEIRLLSALTIASKKQYNPKA
jgi:hypothetical protein